MIENVSVSKTVGMTGAWTPQTPYGEALAELYMNFTVVCSRLFFQRFGYPKPCSVSAISSRMTGSSMVAGTV